MQPSGETFSKTRAVRTYYLAPTTNKSTGWALLLRPNVFGRTDLAVVCWSELLAIGPSSTTVGSRLRSGISGVLRFSFSCHLLSPLAPRRTKANRIWPFFKLLRTFEKQQTSGGTS